MAAKWAVYQSTENGDDDELLYYTDNLDEAYEQDEADWVRYCQIMEISEDREKVSQENFAGLALKGLIPSNYSSNSVLQQMFTKPTNPGKMVYLSITADECGETWRYAKQTEETEKTQETECVDGTEDENDDDELLC